jgi:hypothetical protein
MRLGEASSLIYSDSGCFSQENFTIFPPLKTRAEMLKDEPVGLMGWKKRDWPRKKAEKGMQDVQ